MEDRNRYFDEALSDFVHDVASGGAIRHLVDLGYSLEQMMESLTYPEKKEKIQKTALRYMKESGMLTYELPEGLTLYNFSPSTSLMDISRTLYENAVKYGQENCYISCPFGLKSYKNKNSGLSFLSKREQDYIEGILWDNKMAYHRLTPRMREIGAKLIFNNIEECKVYFPK